MVLGLPCQYSELRFLVDRVVLPTCGTLAYFVDEVDALGDVRELQDLPPLLALAFITIGTTCTEVTSQVWLALHPRGPTHPLSLLDRLYWRRCFPIP